MDYEKKYKEAVELMKVCVPDENGLVHVRPCDIFPELKESEDENIRKYIISFIKMNSGVNLPPDDAKRMLAWFEKQGEQKPAEWSEEDAKMMRNIIDDIHCGTNFNPEVMHAANEREKWFKSICMRYQSKWKPSEGQLECLGYAIDKAEKDYSPLGNNRIHLTLKALKEQLEKL